MMSRPTLSCIGGNLLIQFCHDAIASDVILSASIGTLLRTVCLFRLIKFVKIIFPFTEFIAADVLKVTFHGTSSTFCSPASPVTSFMSPTLIAAQILLSNESLYFLCPIFSVKGLILCNNSFLGLGLLSLKNNKPIIINKIADKYLRRLCFPNDIHPEFSVSTPDCFPLIKTVQLHPFSGTSCQMD